MQRSLREEANMQIGEGLFWKLQNLESSVHKIFH